IITATAPALVPRLWYGMPAYAKDGEVVCFFQNAQKFKARYSTLGFSDVANLDEGAMWPTGFALKELTAAAEAKITARGRKAVRGGPHCGGRRPRFEDPLGTAAIDLPAGWVFDAFESSLTRLV